MQKESRSFEKGTGSINTIEICLFCSSQAFPPKKTILCYLISRGSRFFPFFFSLKDCHSFFALPFSASLATFLKTQNSRCYHYLNFKKEQNYLSEVCASSGSSRTSEESKKAFCFSLVFENNVSHSHSFRWLYSQK